MPNSAEKKHSNYSCKQFCNRKCCPRKPIHFIIILCNFGKNKCKGENKYYLSAERYYEGRDTAAHSLKYSLKRNVYSCKEKACGLYMSCIFSHCSACPASAAPCRECLFTRCYAYVYSIAKKKDTFHRKVSFIRCSDMVWVSCGTTIPFVMRVFVHIPYLPQLRQGKLCVTNYSASAASSSAGASSSMRAFMERETLLFSVSMSMILTSTS